MKNKWVWVLGLLLLSGVIYSIWDYRQWQKAETQNFGQGSVEEKDIAASQPLTLPYVSNFGHFRIKPPLYWKVVPNPTYSNEVVKISTVLPTSRIEIVRFESPDGQVNIKVYLQLVEDSLPDLVDQEAQGITRDRQYFSSVNSNFTVLTWEKEDKFIQKALTAGRGGLVIIESTTSLTSWKAFVRTFEAVYQSWTWI